VSKKVVEMGASTNVAPVIIKRKKIIKSDGHHGGAWKVAYADFVTAMMAFFMLMWLLNATTEKQRKGIADYFSPTVPISRISGGGDGMFGGEDVFSERVLPQNGTGATNLRPTESHTARGATGLSADGSETGIGEEPLKLVEDALYGRGGESLVSQDVLKHIVTRVTDEGLVIELFALDNAPLFKEATDKPTALLRDLSRMIAKVSNLVTNDMALGGHIRAHPVVLANNPVWELSLSRATMMRQLLENGGTEPDRLKRVTGHADRSLAVRNPMSNRNNRIEVILLRSQ
jgi:chemotaxis protein MotB